MNIEKTIYIDMDGVLANFNKKVEELGSSENDKEMWKKINYYNDNVAPFFESLEPLPDSEELVNFIVSNFLKVSILTATGFSTKNAGQQKIIWAKKYFPNIKNILIVESGKDKAKYANKNSVLIDDRVKSIDPFIGKGGTGILYKSAKSTINILKIMFQL